MSRNAVNEPEPLRLVVGRRIRALREESGARQDDVAAAARRHGLAWPRSKVAALERGEKALSAEELLLLPQVLAAALEQPLSVADLFGDDGSVRLSPSSVVAAQDITALLQGRPVLRDPEREAEIERLGPAVRAAINSHVRRVAALGLAHVRSREVGAVERTETETEARVAARLGESRFVLSHVYAHLWGCSLSARRDALVAAALPADAPSRTVQAKRGRITRDLAAEVAEFIANAERGSRGKRRPKD